MMDIRTARLWDIILDGILPVNWPQKPKRTQKQNKHTKHPFKHATLFTHATKHAHIHTTCDRLEMTLNYVLSFNHCFILPNSQMVSIRFIQTQESTSTLFLSAFILFHFNRNYR